MGHRHSHSVGYMRLQFTKSSIAKIPPSKRGRDWHNESELPGFRVAVSTSGRKHFRVRLRSDGRGNLEEYTEDLGAPSDMNTVNQARKRATFLLAQHRLGIKPKRGSAQTEAAGEAGKTLADLFDAFLPEKTGKKKAKTI